MLILNTIVLVLESETDMAYEAIQETSKKILTFKLNQYIIDFLTKIQTLINSQYPVRSI